MISMTASEARRRWFELLDRVAAGEAMVIEHNGYRIILRRDDGPARGASTPDHSALLVPLGDAERAAEWSWRWSADAGLLPGR